MYKRIHGLTWIREWSLITGRGGACEVLPLRKGAGVEKVLAMLKGGGGAQKVLGSFLRGTLEVLAILKGGRKKFQLFKRGGTTIFTLS